MLEKLKQVQWQTLLYGLAGGLLAAVLLLLLNQRPTGTPITLLPPPATITPIPLRVYVTGAVQRPGVYSLPKGSILQAAIEAAGGLTTQADPSKLNLAQLISDGEQIVLPSLPPTRAPTATSGPGTPTPTPEPTLEPTPEAGLAPGTLININTATLAQLDLLPHIGPTIAQRIIDYRTAHGAFSGPEQIMNVDGIGPGTYAQIRDFITVK